MTYCPEYGRIGRKVSLSEAINERWHQRLPTSNRRPLPPVPPPLPIAEFTGLDCRDEIHPLRRAKAEDGAASFLRVPHQVGIGRDGCLHATVVGASSALTPTKLRVSLVHFADSSFHSSIRTRAPDRTRNCRQRPCLREFSGATFACGRSRPSLPRYPRAVKSLTSPECRPDSTL